MGVFFKTALHEADIAGVRRQAGRDSYSPLIPYPTSELISVLFECSQLAFPGVPPREALRRLGQRVFTNLRATSAGTFLFAVAGRKATAALGLVNRAYRLFSTNCTAVPRQYPADGTWVIELRNVWSFVDSYHVGIFEGALAGYGEHPEIRVRTLALADADLVFKLPGSSNS
jgi:uncharacterized protein (TIGR02265 family)